MHPTEARELDWDYGNERELGRHHITVAEVEQVWRNEPLFTRNRRGRTGNWRMIGRTHGGRQLTIIVLTQPDTLTLRPITAWDATTGERTRYF